MPSRIVVVVVIIGFGLLSAWQFSRAQERERQAVDMQASNAVVTDPFAGAFPGARRSR